MIEQNPGAEPFEETWEVVLIPDETIDDHRSTLMISWPSAHLDEMIVPLHWHVREPVQASPKSLFLGVGPPSGKLSKSVEISTNPGTTLKVLNVVTDESSVVLSTNFVQVDDTTTRIDVGAKLPDTEGNYLLHLRVNCDTPLGTVVEVPVICVCRRQSAEKD